MLITLHDLSQQGKGHKLVNVLYVHNVDSMSGTKICFNPAF